MRFGYTHDVMSSYMMPNTKKKRLRQINREIDNPSPIYRMYKKYLYRNRKLSPIPGMNMDNHRKKGGHNMEDGFYFYLKYGHEGFQAWMNHMIQDRISDSLLKNYGSYTRNIIEDSILEFSRPKYRKAKKF
jgi:hypothetical protein